MKKLSTSHVNAQKLKGFIPGNGPTKAQQFYEKAHNNIFMKRCVPTDERKMLQPHSCGISLWIFDHQGRKSQITKSKVFLASHLHGQKLKNFKPS